MSDSEIDFRLGIVNHDWREINPRCCGGQKCAPGHSFGPAARVCWILHYVISGEGIFRSGGREYRLGASQVFVIRPGEPVYYEADRENPWEYLWIGFDCGIEIPPPLWQDVFSLPQGRAVFESLRQAKEYSSGREEYLCGRIWQLFFLLSGSREEAGQKERYVRQAKNQIESEYMSGITVSGVAAGLGLDRSYFSRLFRETEGKSPQRYLNEVRMRQAAVLLSSGDRSVTETALSVGYPDIFSFSRMFRRYYGVSPSEYAARPRKSAAENLKISQNTG